MQKGANDEFPLLGDSDLSRYENMNKMLENILLVVWNERVREKKIYYSSQFIKSTPKLCGLLIRPRFI